jgi:hypothetical protein
LRIGPVGKVGTNGERQRFRQAQKQDQLFRGLFSHKSCAMPDELFLRKAVIGGETSPHDYVVIWDELPIGRIFKSIGIRGHANWTWSCFLGNAPQHSHHRGIAPDLAAAKADFREAWEDLKSSVSYDQIREARRLAADRSRPWQR